MRLTLFFTFYRILTLIVQGFSAIAPNSALGKYFSQRNKQVIHQINSSSILIHCASVGEYESVRPLIQKLKVHDPNLEIVLSFLSSSGYNNVQNQYISQIVYSPIDLPSKVFSWLDKLNPALIIIAENEIWPYFLKEISEKEIPIIHVGIHTSPSFFKNLMIKIIAPILRRSRHFFVEKEATSEILANNRILSFTPINRMRDESVALNALQFQQLPVIENKQSLKPVIIFGSTHQKDILIIKEALKIISDKYDIIIAPHNIISEEINYIKNQLPNLNFSMYSDGKWNDNNILILDRFGILKYAYSYASTVYIGGGFDKGIHNVMEAAVYGKPIITGPYYHDFDNAIELKQHKMLETVSTAEDLLTTLEAQMDKLNSNFYKDKYKTLSLMDQSPSDVIFSYLKKEQLI